MSRSLAKALVAALVLGASALTMEPAAAMPIAGASTYEAAAPAAAEVEQVRLFGRRGGFGRRGFGGRGFGYRRGFGHRRGFGYRRGIPGRPIRRILRAL